MAVEFLIVLCIVSRISTQVGYFIILYHLKKRYIISILISMILLLRKHFFLKTNFGKKLNNME